jgi:hypothetical protein
MLDILTVPSQTLLAEKTLTAKGAKKGREDREEFLSGNLKNNRVNAAN